MKKIRINNVTYRVENLPVELREKYIKPEKKESIIVKDSEFTKKK